MRNVFSNLDLLQQHRPIGPLGRIGPKPRWGHHAPVRRDVVGYEDHRRGGGSRTRGPDIGPHVVAR